MSQAEVLPGH